MTLTFELDPDTATVSSLFVQMQLSTQIYVHKGARSFPGLMAWLQPFSRTTWVSQHQKGKPFWILLAQEMMG